MSRTFKGGCTSTRARTGVSKLAGSRTSESQLFAVKGLGLMFLCTLLFSGCRNWPGQELQRVTSPDGLVDAVLTREEYGATVADGYYLYVVRRGEPPEKNEHVAMFQNPLGIELRWAEAAVLDVAFKKARVYDFRNSKSVVLGEMKVDSIEIRLCPQEKYSVPDGGNPPRGVWP